MKNAVIFVKITLIVKKLFDKRTGEELEAIKRHFGDAYNDAQLVALVFVGMICRIFGLIPPPKPGSRNILLIVGLFVQWLQGLDDPVNARALIKPSRLDAMVSEGVSEFDLSEIREA